ncbi:unnamed protein product [Caenorhabditis brenneri]
MRTSWLLLLILPGFIKSATQFILTNRTTCDLSKEFDCGTGILGCLPKAWKCDNIKDCHNGADEVDCEPNDCPEGDFLCKNGKFMEHKYKCDGIPDCSDFSDEKFCEYNSRRLQLNTPFNFGDPNLYGNESGLDKNGCHPGFGFCSLQKTCIPNKLFCDGEAHCFPDYEDERNCTPDGPAAAYKWSSCMDNSKFACNKNKTWDNLVCIEMEEVCNGKKDCPLGDDETEKCSECSTKHCQYQCKNTLTGPKCVCEKGYRLASDGFSCVDLDECTLPERACHHFCENRIGSFHCSCAKGYHLEADGISCELSDTSQGSLLFSFSHEIKERPLEDFSETNFTVIHQIDGYVHGFDYSRRDDKIFLIIGGIDMEKQELVVQENGEWKTLRENISTSTNLIVDWIGGNLFYMEPYLTVEGQNNLINRITVCTLSGKFCRKLIESDSSHLSCAFAIHPMRGLLFFTGLNNDTFRIMMANMDGSQVQPLLEYKGYMIQVFAIDYTNHDLYFSALQPTSNGVETVIRCVNIDTKKTEVIASTSSTVYHSTIDTMVYHNGFLYWTETLNHLRVLEVARKGARVHKVLMNSPSWGYCSHIVANSSQYQLEPTAGNPCKALDCPWICVIVPEFTAKCLCPDGHDCTPFLKDNEKHDNPF